MKEEPDLIDIFAMFAMLKMDWRRGQDKQNAEDAYAIAESMMNARKLFNSEGEVNEQARPKRCSRRAAKE